MRKNTRFRIKVACLGLLSLSLAGICYQFVLSIDSVGRRKRIHQEIKKIQLDAREHPDNPAHVQKLARIAKGRYGFGATIATAAMGECGESGKYVIKDLGELLRSSNPYVAREAAISLGKQKTACAALLPELEAALDRDTDVAWFSAEAIGKCGGLARRSLTALRSKLGRSRAFDEYLIKAINEIESKPDNQPP
jgi:hypothetical protein